MNKIFNKIFIVISIFTGINFFYILFVILILKPVNLGLVFNVMWGLYFTTIGLFYLWMLYYYKVKYEILDQVKSYELLRKNKKWRTINVLQLVILLPIWTLVLWIPLIMTGGSLLGLLEDGSPAIAAIGMLFAYYYYDKELRKAHAVSE